MSNSAHRGTPNRRPAVIALITLVSVVGIGTAAYAYWTTTGSGTGSAATGTSQSIAVNQTTTVTGLAPGVAPQALAGDFTNPNPGPVSVGAVTATVSIVPAVSGCTAADYAITGTGEVANGGVVPSGTNVGSWSGLSIEFVNSETRNQDACKNVPVTITYSAPILPTP